jgi:hypothetical protein
MVEVALGQGQQEGLNVALKDPREKTIYPLLFSFNQKFLLVLIFILLNLNTLSKYIHFISSSKEFKFLTYTIVSLITNRCPAVAITMLK